MPQAKKKRHPVSLAVGGRYDRLVERLKRVGKLARESFGGGRGTPGTSAVAVCGVSIKEEVLLSSMCQAFTANQVKSHYRKVEDPSLFFSFPLVEFVSNIQVSSSCVLVGSRKPSC